MPAASLRTLFWIALGAAVLLTPALVWGRPFVFFDTPDYFGWGRDVVAALARPWPHAGQPWLAGRPLYGWPGGATLNDLRFMLSGVSGRSAFYAVPLFALTSAGGFWLVAVLQALVVAATLRVAVRAAAPAAGASSYLLVVALLTAVSSIGFEAALMMPDLFGGLALLAASLLIAAPSRLSWQARTGLGALVAYAVLAHPANLLLVATAIVFGLIGYARLGLPTAAARVAPVAAALGAALAVGGLGQAVIASAFGRAIPTAPVIAGRVLADGAAQRYLAAVCPRAALASCDLAGVQTGPEYYQAIYPLAPPPKGDPRLLYDRLQYHPITDAEAAQRERFVAEQPRLVMGAFLADGPRLAGVMLARSAAAFLNFRVGADFDSLNGLLAEKTRRRDQIAALTPPAPRCGQAAAASSCAASDVGRLAPLQGLAVALSFGFIGLGLIGKLGELAGELKALMRLSVCLLLANALICGALAGPYARYQARVEWVAPLTALLGTLELAARRRAPTNAATLPSPSASIVASASR